MLLIDEILIRIFSSPYILNLSIMKYAIFLFCAMIAYPMNAQNTEQQNFQAIKNLLEEQRLAWNNYDLEAFMEGYWKSDSLKFYGSNGVTHGWKNTLERYQKGYPSKAHTGELVFKIKSISKIEDTSYYVMGAFFLYREVGDANGIFMIVLKKIDGQWKIIADTSC